MNLIVRVLGFPLALAALAALALTVLGEAGRIRPAFDMVNHFRLIAAPASAALLVAAIMLARLIGAPRPRLMTFALVCSLAATLWHAFYLAPEARRFLPGPATASGPTLTVATFNMLKGATRAGDLVAFVEANGIEVLVLQEVGVGGRPALARLAALLPHQHVSGGLAILSRHPLTDRQAPPSTRPTGLMTQPDAILATVSPSDMPPLRVIGVHFGWPEPAMAGQPVQIDWLAATVAAGDARHTLVLGDFNSTPFSHEFRRSAAMLPLDRATIGLATFPTREVAGVPTPVPFLPIDHVFAGRALTPVSVRRGPDLGSDHYPVVVRFQAARWADTPVRGTLPP